MEKRVSRREFLKYTAVGALGGAILYGGYSSLLAGRASADSQKDPATYDSTHHWRFVVDIRKCIGCGRCVNACKAENHVPPEPQYTRTWIERYVVTDNEQITVDSPALGKNGFINNPEPPDFDSASLRKTFFVPKLCNMCERPPCLQVCPVGATYRTKEGVVLVDRNTCIGCRYCIQACPWGVRYKHPELKVVDKCTWCYHRITKGLRPACVEACSVGARNFGDITDPESTVSKLLKNEVAGELKPEVGCHAKTLYLGLEKGVR